MRKKWFAYIIPISLFLAAVFWMSGGFSKEGSKNKEKLFVATWSCWIPTSAVKEFEEANNCEVIFEYHTSSEEFALKAASVTENDIVDIVILSKGCLKPLDDLGYLRPIDISKIERIDSINHPSLYIKDGEVKSISYTISSTSVICNLDVAKSLGITMAELENIDILENPKARGRINFENDPRDVYSYALSRAGKNINTESLEDVKEAEKILKRWRKNVSSMDFGISDVIAGNLLLTIEDIHDSDELFSRENLKVYHFNDKHKIVVSNDIILANNKDKEELVYNFLNTILKMEHVNQLCEDADEVSHFAGSGFEYKGISGNVMGAINKQIEKYILTSWVKFRFNTL